MINDDVQQQKGGNQSTNVQGKSVTIQQGISYTDAKEIALDVYKANFLELSKEAAELAITRAEELTDHFLEELRVKKPDYLYSASNPAMQMAIFNAQKEYARTGDKNLEDLLVDILVERATESERNIHQIVLDESLQIAPKLTKEQLDALTVSFLITKTRNNKLINFDYLKGFLQSHLAPFVKTLSTDSSCYAHLEYAGCGSVMHLGSLQPLENVLLHCYPGLFCKGFDKNELEKTVGTFDSLNGVIIPCLHDKSKFQASGMDNDRISEICEIAGIEEGVCEKLKGIQSKYRMSDKEVKIFICSITPDLNHLFNVWNDSELSKFHLTTVGIALAHANFRITTGIKLRLDTWIR